MNRLSDEKRVLIVKCLVEGMSLRSTARLTGVHRTTIMKLLQDLGGACSEYQDKVLRGLRCATLQCDEIWSYCYARQKNATDELRDRHNAGDVWTWVAIDPDTKLVPCWLSGRRDAVSAMAFMHDLRRRVNGRVQLVTDGHKPYTDAVEAAFGSEADYGQVVKIYGDPAGDRAGRYAGSRKTAVSGRPDESKVSTSIIERQNLTMRMGMKRFARKSTGFSKKLENHAHAIALHFMYYNFCRLHSSIRCTPAVEAGVESSIWEISDLLRLV